MRHFSVTSANTDSCVRSAVPLVLRNETALSVRFKCKDLRPDATVHHVFWQTVHAAVNLFRVSCDFVSLAPQSAC